MRWRVSMELNELHTGKKLINHYKSLLEKYRFQIYNAPTVEEQKKILQEVYKFMKEVAVKTYNSETGFNKIYRSVVGLVPSLEENIKKEYILDVKPNFDYKKAEEKWQTLSKEKKEDILQFMVDTIRITLYRKLNKKEGSSAKPLESFDLQGYCFPTADMVKQIGDTLSLKTTKITIEPGFIHKSPLFNNRKKHCCSFVQIQDELYLIDCTYLQFFLLKDCILERLGIPMLSGCAPGAFMIMDDTRRKVAEKILKDGWIKVTPEVLKAYMDGFALSFRNGLYYENTNDFSFSTNYTAEDYIRFLFGNDSQLHYEGEESLGFQKKPLSNAEMQFTSNHFNIAK